MRMGVKGRGREALSPEHAEGSACEVGILDERHILCAAEGYGNIVAKLLQGLPRNLPLSTTGQNL